MILWFSWNSWGRSVAPHEKEQKWHALCVILTSFAMSSHSFLSHLLVPFTSSFLANTDFSHVKGLSLTISCCNFFTLLVAVSCVFQSDPREDAGYSCCLLSFTLQQWQPWALQSGSTKEEECACLFQKFHVCKLLLIHLSRSLLLTAPRRAVWSG